ncbi:MAG TPA: PQQ-binding-like beta-propeller repeat protein [Pirellulales bacterium]|nr:PQQ-binding-like beta-propeller repeat protein [Pirellulales bacterium]
MRAYIAAIAALSAIPGAAPIECRGEAGDWPQFLGPHRSGISAEIGLLETWPEGGPKELWRAPGGVGMSGLALRDRRLVTLVQREGKQWLAAYDARTGKPLWQVALAPEYRNAMGDGPRATPAIAGDRVFAFTGEGILAAVNFADGKLLWSHDLLDELEAEEADYGMACSPLVVGDLVVVTIGAQRASVVALDASSGKLAWRAGDDPAGYSSPAVLNVGGREQLVASTGVSVLGLAPKTGAVLWRYPFETNFNCNIAAPIAVGDRVFISAGEDHGSVLLALKPEGRGFETEEVWSSLGTRSVLRNEWQTSILLDGYLYGMDNVGGAGPITHLTCIKADTGERAWQKTRFGKGNLIAADGKLFISTMKGELVVLRATPEKYEELGRSIVVKPTRQAPALAGGLLYLRDDAEIVCLDVRRP